MIRSLRVGAGFQARPTSIASTRLTHAVAASLAIGCLSLCFILALTVMSIRVASAMPL
ncbi:hypothetical protein [Tardiphaga sp.]|uniref:hypothetical protein n=1 Tax=Tardiphaga sp. TaxID=1926292 RepID=UPI00352BCB1F